MAYSKMTKRIWHDSKMTKRSWHDSKTFPSLLSYFLFFAVLLCGYSRRCEMGLCGCLALARLQVHEFDCNQCKSAQISSPCDPQPPLAPLCFPPVADMGSACQYHTQLCCRDQTAACSGECMAARHAPPVACCCRIHATQLGMEQMCACHPHRHCAEQPAQAC